MHCYIIIIMENWWKSTLKEEGRPSEISVFKRIKMTVQQILLFGILFFIILGLPFHQFSIEILPVLLHKKILLFLLLLFCLPARWLLRSFAPTGRCIILGIFLPPMSCQDNLNLRWTTAKQAWMHPDRFHCAGIASRDGKYY